MTLEARRWLAQATGLDAEALTLERMRGASSASVYRVSNPTRAGQVYVLRLFTLKTWLANEPDLARHEAAALREAHRAGLPAPELMAWLPGPSGESPEDPVGFGAPAVLMAYLPGRVELAPEDEGAWLKCMAHTLCKVHQHQPAVLDWRYKSWVEPGNVAVPARTGEVTLWEAAVTAYNRWKRADTDNTFLHRDYHALNALFGGHGSAITVTGVVDWVNACVGPAAADISHCRIDLVKMKGVGAAQRFLGHYAEARGGFDYDPGWDLEAVFDVAASEPGAHAPWFEFGLPKISDQTVRVRVEEFLRRALVDLGINIG